MNTMNEQKKLLSTIQSYSFVITEAVLYLDTHPRCKKALRFYEKYNRLYHEAVRMYENKYGPLTMYGVNTDNPCDSWKWVETPWPWEG